MAAVVLGVCRHTPAGDERRLPPPVSLRMCGCFCALSGGRLTIAIQHHTTDRERPDSAQRREDRSARVHPIKCTHGRTLLPSAAAAGGSASSVESAGGDGNSDFLKRCHESRARPADSITSGTWSSRPLTAKSSTEATPAMARMTMMAVPSTDPYLPCHGSDRVRRQPRSKPLRFGSRHPRGRTRKCSRSGLLFGPHLLPVLRLIPHTHQCN